jgi:hypothetical protein
LAIFSAAYNNSFNLSESRRIGFGGDNGYVHASNSTLGKGGISIVSVS